MQPVHRVTDTRTCGAATVASTRNVLINGLSISLTGDTNSHGGGALTGTARNIFVNGLSVVVVGSPAAPDSLCPTAGGAHCAPAASTGSPNVFIGV